MAYPKKYRLEHAPASVRVLVEQVLPRMLQGSGAALGLLREQLRQATVSSVELSGVGFFAHLAVPSGLSLADPRRIVGGNAEIALSGVEHGAGCLLFVDDGQLSVFEGYTCAGEEWTEDAKVTSIGRITPIDAENPALQAGGCPTLPRSRRRLP